MIEYVVKRDGSTEKFDPVKLNKWAEYATAVGGNWSEIAQKTFKRLQNYCKTTDIHDTMVSVCLAKQSLEYSRVASRLEFAEIRKGMQYKLGFDDRTDFKTIYAKLIEIGVWDKNSLPEYSEKIEQMYAEIITVRLDYWQVKQWVEKYAVKVDGVVVETPHIGYMGLALALFGGTDEAREYAMCLAQGKINLPTPALNGLRNGDWDTISCCVISAGDNVESIGAANYLAYRMTAKKAGIGIEYTTRSKGDSVKQGRIEHLGKHPILKTLDREVKTMTQITRGGNATATILCIDPEIENLILVKSQRIDIEQRIDKLDYEFGYNDAFLQAVIKDEPWYLFSLVDAPKLYDLFYTAFANEYNQEVQKLLSAGTKHKKLKARELLSSFLTVRQETGRYYDNNLTRTNQHTPFIDVIRQSNLCVVPETKILTDKGYVEISSVCGEKTNVWNGEEWSSVEVKKTGENQKIVRVETNSGQSLECTEYHKFYTIEKNKWNRTKVVEKRAGELKAGDLLIKFDLPIIEGTTTLEDAWLNGFYSGDGFVDGKRQRVYFYGQKRKMVSAVKSGALSHAVQEEQDREILMFGHLKDKFFVPDCTYTLASRMEWLAGIFDSDGTLCHNNNTQSIQLTSVNQKFLKDIQLMLQTCGIVSKIQSHGSAGYKPLPANDGSGESKLFYCQASYRLLIGNHELTKLQNLGISFRRLSPDSHKANRECLHFNKVKGVYDDGRVSDTFCFTEPKRNMGMFNGMLTGQCEEIALPTKPYSSMQDLFKAKSDGETAFCSLSAINVSKVQEDEQEKIAYLALKAVNKMIDKAPMLTESMKESIMRRRSVGIGITGLASLLYSKGLDYVDTPETLDFVQKIAEEHYFYLLKASQKMAQDDNYCADGVNLNWLPIDTAVNKSIAGLDWEALRGKPRKHSVLVAHMPTESSSLLSGSSNGLYPVRRKIINKRSRKGLVQFICKEFVEGQTIPAWEVDTITLSKIYARVQDFTDQAISCDFYVSPNRNGGKLSMAQMMKEWVAHAKLGNKTKYYLNTDDYNGGSFQDILEKEPEEEEACESCKL